VFLFVYTPFTLLGVPGVFCMRSYPCLVDISAWVLWWHHRLMSSAYPRHRSPEAAVPRLCHSREDEAIRHFAIAIYDEPDSAALRDHHRQMSRSTWAACVESNVPTAPLRIVRYRQSGRQPSVRGSAHASWWL